MGRIGKVSLMAMTVVALGFWTVDTCRAEGDPFYGNPQRPDSVSPGGIGAYAANLFGTSSPGAFDPNTSPPPARGTAVGTGTSQLPSGVPGAGGAAMPYAGAGMAPGAAGAGMAPGPSGAAPGAATPGPALGADSSTFSPVAGGALGGSGGVFNMLGDQIEVPALPRVPPSIRGALPQKGGSSFPWVRGFKIADNQSPLPQDRVYFSFNYYNNLNYAVNRRLNAPVSGIQVYRYQLGLEKTFLDGMASIGFRDDIDNLSQRSTDPALAGTHTAVGDLNIYTKFVLYRFGNAFGSFGTAPVFGGPLAPGGGDGGLISGGLNLTLPTGPGSFAGARSRFVEYLETAYGINPTGPGPFAGARSFKAFRDTAIQPFLGYYWSRGNFYLHGFESINVPTDKNDVTAIFNDVGIGYYLYRDLESDRLIRAFAPTFEVHVNVPLNHRDVFNPRDVAGSADVVDLTLGGNVLLGRRVVLTGGVVTPVTGPRPFAVEAIALINVFFGGRRGAMISPAAPLIGQ